MKQGRASRDVKESWKVEPKPRAIAPGKAAAIGIQEVRYRKPDGAGNAYSAPMHSQATHKAGSQGRH